MILVDLSNISFAAAAKAECKAELEFARWAQGFVCPACGNKKAYLLRTRPVKECANKKCKRQTSATAGTQFHNTRTIDKIWTLLKCWKNKIEALPKSVIKTTMDVSARTAERVYAIIALSFNGERQMKDQRLSKSGQSTLYRDKICSNAASSAACRNWPSASQTKIILNGKVTIRSSRPTTPSFSDTFLFSKKVVQNGRAVRLVNGSNKQRRLQL